MPSRLRTSAIFTILTAALVAYIFPSIQRRLLVLGIAGSRPEVVPGIQSKVVSIEDTVHCEDIHYLPATNELITACENNDRTRAVWFPGLVHLNASSAVSYEGSLHVIDSITLKSRRLKLLNFPGPFVTHGIDVIPDPDTKRGYFIFAINHLPHPEHAAGHSDTVHKARSQIELFHYVSGSNSATHIRSIRHDLISTPNDIYAIDKNSFFVTNDHYYREGLLRDIEDIFPTATWSTVIHVQISNHPKFITNDPAESGITASIALKGIHNNNGMGHGPKISDSEGTQHHEVLITSAGSGIFYRAIQEKPNNNNNLKILSTIPLPSTLDNPSHYIDPYPHLGSAGDSSGYILCGLGSAVSFISQIKEPDHKASSVVWHVQRNTTDENQWITRLLWEDNDGTYIRGATTAVLVPIDPEKGTGKKKKKKMGRLFVASVVGKAVVAVDIDL